MLVEFEKSKVTYKNIFEKIGWFFIYKFLDLLYYINAYDHTHKTFDYTRIVLCLLCIGLIFWFILGSFIIILASIKFLLI